MKRAIIYPTRDRGIVRVMGGRQKTFCYIARQELGKIPDKPRVLELFEK